MATELQSIRTGESMTVTDEVYQKMVDLGYIRNFRIIGKTADNESPLVKATKTADLIRVENLMNKAEPVKLSEKKGKGKVK